MLSPHEFATLMLIRNAPDQIGHEHANLDELLQRQLVALNRRLPAISIAFSSDQQYFEVANVHSFSTGRDQAPSPISINPVRRASLLVPFSRHATYRISRVES